MAATGPDRRKLMVFVSAATIRLFLFAAFPSLPNLLTGRVEISTPVSSFKRCNMPALKDAVQIWND